MSDVPVFVVGDIHGHIDRLEALLKEAGVKEKECVTVQLGDLGHFGGSSGSPTADLMAWQLAHEGLVDYVLWGNHDRAVVDTRHIFGGYDKPDATVLHIMRLMEAEGRLLFAYETHGWLITHAGLHAQWKYTKKPKSVDHDNPKAIAEWLNSSEAEESDQFTIPERQMASPLIDAVGRMRGGWSPYGGILWRDIREKLYGGFPQVFGHSADKNHLVRGEQDKWYCVDIGGKGGHLDPDADCLAGIWLPSQEIVRVDMNKE